MVLIDDRMENIETVAEYCKSVSFPFKGILFQPPRILAGKLTDEMITWQKEQLMHTITWFEDHEVITHFKKKRPDKKSVSK